MTDVLVPHNEPSGHGTSPILEIRDLHVTYGKAVKGLRGVSLDLNAGEVVALLGANGAGKTTLLRAVSGLLARHGAVMGSGRVVVAGTATNGRDPVNAVRLGARMVMEGRRLFGNMTVRDNLLSGAALLPGRSARHQAVDDIMDRFPLLREKASEPAALLSGGQQQIVAIARALVGQPSLLMLDEPSLGLAPQSAHAVAELVRQLHREGMSVLLVEQNVAMALDLATRAYVLTRGRVVRSGSSAELLADPQLSDLYLGSAYGESEAIAEHASTTGLPSASQRGALPWYR